MEGGDVFDRQSVAVIKLESIPRCQTVTSEEMANQAFSYADFDQRFNRLPREWQPMTLRLLR